MIKNDRSLKQYYCQICNTKICYETVRDGYGKCKSCINRELHKKGIFKC
jgi:hypothetical protein